MDEKIKRWLEGRMSPLEAEAFETEMAADPLLAEQVKSYSAAAVPPPIPVAPPPLPPPLPKMQTKDSTTSDKAGKKEKWIAWVAVLLGIWVLNRVLTGLIGGSPVDSKTFKENFDRPEGIMSDLMARPLTDSSYVLSEACEEQLRAADKAYKAGDLKRAQNKLVDILTDTSFQCQSEAWFFVGVIRLESGDPRAAIDCFSKIEDMERFTDDISWYNALAMVQMAEGNPALQHRAQRAMSKILDQPGQPEARKEKARQILEKTAQ